jgi:DNA-directed RNA polymerase specialized sigma24 family protein
MKQPKSRIRHYLTLSDRALLAGLRRGDDAALYEYFLRFGRSLRRIARVSGVQPALLRETVLQCLDDALMALTQPGATEPRSLAAYLATSLRHDILNIKRDEQRRTARTLRVREGTAASEWVIVESCSEASIRASNGPDFEAPPALHPALARLVSLLDEGLSNEEAQILTWIGDLVPQRVIADWLGISYGAARARVVRLRTRLREAATRLNGPFTEEDRRVLDRFFRRTAPTAAGKSLLFGRPRPPSSSQHQIHSSSDDQGARPNEESDADAGDQP